MGAEDFSYVLQRVPGAMMFLGGTPAGTDPTTAAPNHSNRVVFDEQAMTTGIAMYAAVALDRPPSSPATQALPAAPARWVDGSTECTTRGASIRRNVYSTAPRRGSVQPSRSSPGIVVDGAHTWRPRSA